MPLKFLQRVGSLLSLPLEESGGERRGGHHSPALAGREEKHINRSGWSLFKSLLCRVRYLKFSLKAMLVVNWRVEDQGPRQKLDCKIAEGLCSLPGLQACSCKSEQPQDRAGV